jgi:D-alanyl-D-alanine carboxypeptidase (penicillin-binding protein 5/6)
LGVFPPTGVLGFALAAVLALAGARPARAAGPWQTPVVPGWRVGRDLPVAPPRLDSASAVLMDPVSGRLLYEHAAFVRRPPASTTKILTAYLTIRAGHLDRIVTVSARAAATGGSRMHLRRGERLPVRTLLAGLLMRSGNDAAAALAEARDGSIERFAARMNRTARSLGARASHFENPHGLPDPRHYTTAYDLARIARAALALPTFRALVAAPVGRVRDADGRVFEMHNTNHLLTIFPGADGVKTGTTNAAGRCLVSSATRGGFPLLGVVLHSPDRWGESASLLAWGYGQFVPVASGVGSPLAYVRDATAPMRARRLGLTLASPLTAVVPRALVPPSPAQGPGPRAGSAARRSRARPAGRRSAPLPPPTRGGDHDR